MKNFFKVAFLLFATLTLSSCSSDDDSGNNGGDSPSFSLKNETYNLVPQGSIIQMIDMDEEGSFAQITISGTKDSKSGTIRFIANFDNSISGTYTDGEMGTNGTFDTEGSNYITTELINGSQEIRSEGGAEGTLKITQNQNNNYTVEFDVVYDDGVVAQGNITTDFVVQSL